MKAKRILFAASVWAFVLGAAAAAPKWVACPIGWRIDAGETIVARGGLGAFATRDMARARVGEFHVRATPQGAGTNGWATLGLSLRDDDRNFWHVAFVRTPPQDGERHTFELCEMRGGEWLSQAADKLVCTERRQTGEWAYGTTYDLSLQTTAEGIRGEVKDLAGKTLFSCAYAFPKPAADGSVKAVTAGRLALHSTGGLRGTFTAPQATVVQEMPQPPSDFPPYASDSFVPDVTDKATGYFRLVEKEGRWWTIDPLGRGTVLLGVDHVTYWGHYSARAKISHYHEAMKAKFPDKADWEAETLARLKGWGFNLLGAGCDSALKHRGLIHTIFLSIGDGLCWDGLDAEYYICPNEHRPCSAFPNVFHPDFPRWADYQARKSCAPNRNDPWLFGYFIDNELAWWGRGRQDTGLFDAVFKLPETHSAKQALRQFVAARGVKGPTIPDAVKLDFLKLAAERYFKIASEAIRRHDPNHLVMGARFAGLGGAHPAVWEASGKYCDVVTFNCYPWADLDRNVMFTDRGAQAKRIVDAFTEQYQYVKKPMLITEWSFPALDSGLPCTGGAGQRFQTQAQRTQATELFAKTMLSLPFLVGYDYFMWVDEPPEGISDAFPEDSNYGLINEKGDAYPEITAMFTRLHKTVGAWRRAPVPAARAAAAATGVCAADFLARLPADTARATVTRTGDVYTVKNAAGLELTGRVGGANFFDAVKLNGRTLGRYSAMLNDRVGGSLRWRDIARVTALDVEEKGGRVVLTLTGELRGGAHDFALTHRVTVFGDKPWFLCELVEARNLGIEPIDVNAFYFRQYAPFATDKAGRDAPKTVPNLWKAPSRDAWYAADGAYWGGLTQAATVTMFTYHLMNNNTSQHPDAMFAPERALVLKPGEAYAPKGSTWMLALGGLDGQTGWQRAVEGLK